MSFLAPSQEKTESNNFHIFQRADFNLVTTGEVSANRRFMVKNQNYISMYGARPLWKLFSPLVDLKVGTLGEDDGLLLLILVGGLLDTQSGFCCLIFHPPHPPRMSPQPSQALSSFLHHSHSKFQQFPALYYCRLFILRYKAL